MKAWHTFIGCCTLVSSLEVEKRITHVLNGRIAADAANANASGTVKRIEFPGKYVPSHFNR